MTKPVLLGITDLVFSTRVNSVARTFGCPTLATFSTHDLLSKAHAEEAEILFLDLEDSELNPLYSIKELKRDDHTQKVFIVGVMTKSNAELRAQAENSGCDLVMVRSQFLESMKEILTGSAKMKKAEHQ